MIRRRDNIWVSIHAATMTMPNRSVLRPDTSIDTSIPVTYTAPTTHNMVMVGNITELVPWPGYVTGTGRINSAHSGTDSISQTIIDEPYQHRARAQWVIDFIDGEVLMRIRAIHITRSDRYVSSQEVAVTRPSEKFDPCPYNKSRTATSAVATARVARPSPSPRP